jgi:hypothetical protein
MVRLCSKSSRSYSGRPAARAHRQRWGRWPGMVAVREQESAEAVVPRVTSRQTPEGLTTREGLNLAGRTRPSVVLTRSDEADRLSIRAAITVAEKEWLLRPQGLPGTAVRGPACTVVWEAGGATLPPTRLGQFMRIPWFNKLTCVVGAQRILRGQHPRALPGPHKFDNRSR